jgi:hypothetical protein
VTFFVERAGGRRLGARGMNFFIGGSGRLELFFVRSGFLALGREKCQSDGR